MFKKIDKNANRVKRHLRIRKNLTGTSEKPRLCLFKSNTNIYAQLIDDVNHNTLVAASTLDKDYKGESKSNMEAAKLVGELIGKRAIDKGIEQCVFDRSGYLYHGKVKELAEGARSAGLKF